MGLLRSDVSRPIAWPPPRTPDQIARAWQYAPRRDPIGHQVHTVLAALHLATLPLMTAGSAVSFAALFVYAALRAPTTWRSSTALLRAPMSWAMLAWVAWFALSLTWSENPGQGFDELRAARMLLLPVLLWPVLDRLPWLIAAALAGVALQNLVQITQALELFGLAPEVGGRVRGLIHPIQTGAWCTAALCWHLAALLNGRRTLRAIAAVGLLLAAAGLLATGSRGPWLAAAIVLPAMLAGLAWRRRAARPMAAGLVLIAVIALAVAWPALRAQLLPRVGAASAEIAEARHEGLYTSSVSLRLGLWTWAWQVFRQHPVIGTGAGDFETTVAALPAFRHAVDRALEVGSLEGHAASDEAIRDYLSRGHAHSTYLHTLAQLGLVGAALLGVLLGTTLVQCGRDEPNHAWADGTVFVLLAWMIGAQFDCYELNGHLFGLLALVIAATWPYRPAPRGALFEPVSLEPSPRLDAAREHDGP